MADINAIAEQIQGLTLLQEKIQKTGGRAR